MTHIHRQAQNIKHNKSKVSPTPAEKSELIRYEHQLQCHNLTSDPPQEVCVREGVDHISVCKSDGLLSFVT